MQPAQAIDIVDIVPDRQIMNFETDLAGALAGLLGNALGAPIDVIEHVAMRRLEPEQVISAVA